MFFMGYAERKNKNSKWYKEHHPEAIVQKEIPQELKPKVGFIRKLINKLLYIK